MARSQAGFLNADASELIPKYRLVIKSTTAREVDLTTDENDVSDATSADQEVASGTNGDFELLGGKTIELEASEAITVGADVFAAASGKIQVVPVGSGTYRRVGKALAAASGDNSIIEVLYNPIDVVVP